MSEKFKTVVNAPHKAFGRARKKIAAMQPQTKKGKAARGAGVALTGMFQFLLWAVKYAALDNHLTRGMEKKLGRMTVGKNKKGEDKKLAAFAKKYPNLSSHMLYYMMLGGLVAGGGAAYDHVFGDEENTVSSETVIGIDQSDIRVFEANTYGAYMAKMEPVTPYLISQLIVQEGVRMNDAGMHVVYDDADGHVLRPGERPRGVATIGFGSTMLKDNTKVTSNTPPISSAEAYELARHHLEVGETYFIMYCYEIGTGRVQIDDTKKALMLGSMLYNMGSNLIEEENDKNHRKRFAELRQLYSQYGFGVSDDDVRALFERYPVQAPTSFGKILLGYDKRGKLENCAGLYLKAGGKLAPGLVWRRWLEAGLLTGDIKPQDLLDIPLDGMPEFYKRMCKDVGGDKKKAFFTGGADNRRVNRATYAKLREWIQNPVNKHGRSMTNKPKVGDVLPQNVVELCRSGQCELGNMLAVIRPQEAVRTDSVKQDTIEKKMSVEEATYVIGYDNMYAAAVKSFRARDYEAAVRQFEAMIDSFPGNALLHNDAAATYNKLGRYDKAIEHARIILHEIGDKSQYGAAQYNAGFAYEKKGDLQKALANYKLALANGNRRVQKDITRVTRLIQKQGRGRGKSQRTAYMHGAKKLENNAYSAEFDITMGRGGRDLI